MPATQVIKEANPQKFSVEYIQNMSHVDDYKSLLTQIRLSRTGFLTQIQSLMADIQNLSDAHDHMLDQFRLNALAMHPEYQGQDLKAIILSLPATDPLAKLWVIANQNINDVRNAIASKTMALDQLTQKEKAARDQEDQTVKSYADFAANAKTTVPTVQDLLGNLAAVGAIPVSTQGKSVRAYLPAIEELDPEAAAAVTLQIAQGNTGEPVDLAMSVQAPVQTITAPQVVPSFKTAHPILFVGGIALASMFFLGRSSK